MHVYYKFGLLLIFILSISTCCTRAAPATNQSSSYDDDYPDDYVYYDETESDQDVSSTTSTTTPTPKPNRLMPTTTINDNIELPKRSNHVLEPNCPKACLCLEDFKFIQCANAQLTHVPKDLPKTALIVDLSNNRIGELRVSDFANCTKVQEINLSNNELREVNQETFKGLKRLQRLRLSSNHLTHIDPQTFTAATALDLLDLSSNTIHLPKEGSFINQPDLLQFSCRNCSWSTLYDETFANLSSLTTLKLDLNDFNKKINTKAFSPLRNLIKLKLPELDQSSVQELCNLLKSIDNISFKHFDVSCYELVLGTSYNESLILTTDPPYIVPEGAKIATTPTSPAANKPESPIRPVSMTESHVQNASSNLTDATNVLLSGIHSGAEQGPRIEGGADGEEKPYQVPVSQEAINIMLIAIMIIAVIGIIIGIICRRDVGGIKTKCCRTRKPEPKDQVHPTEEIPLNKLA